MHSFLAAFCARLNPPSGDLATIVSDTEIEADKMSSDPAALSDWLRAVNQVLGRPDDAAQASRRPCTIARDGESGRSPMR
jgi:hypothetical protein